MYNKMNWKVSLLNVNKLGEMFHGEMFHGEMFHGEAWLSSLSVALFILFVWVIKFAFTVIAFVRIHCFFMRKLNNKTALLQKTIKTN